MAKSRRL